ncbi:BZ3500_MvSof-1268-A1-R1_Chr1-1g00946 [Microbotryum saponariae]|uniref:BZ3500_MvSof-1268-A1-R1_Chr1-1g00946 protein n=1 Tax=Microbotryum saponariae TaxID=289078 RepID=A0A2X0KM99_9BASI|nr:BZ3500_MvSof-1268-A1-R1_Chr1-1g00946 [Microbotryum saponariae]SCZ92998.1 BZ3501_MvSof-1269-A2-R1_Chr1-1g00543 [Microbotryum saponariae]
MRLVFHPFLVSGLLFGSVIAARDAQIQQLVSLLAPADPSTIQGTSTTVPGFTLDVLTNSSHALFAFTVPKGRDAIGWISLGFGTVMADSAMVILWPNEAYTAWQLSARSVVGHMMPLASSANWTDIYSQARSYDALEIRTSCTATFIRPLEFPSDQTIYPAAQAKHLSVSRSNTQQPFIWASASDRPDSDDPASQIDVGQGRNRPGLDLLAYFAVILFSQKHSMGMFGSFTLDMTKPYVSLSSSAPASGSASSDMKSKIIMAHAALGVVVWTLLAPMGVLIGRYCRANPSWYLWHSTVQGYVVVPATILIFSFGFYASRGGDGSPVFTAHEVSRAHTEYMSSKSLAHPCSLYPHQAFGIILLIAVLAQATLGHIAHRTPGVGSLTSLGDERTTTRSPSRAAHILLGCFTMLIAIIQVQLGLKLYSSARLSFTYTVLAVLFLIIFLTLYLGSLVRLVFTRAREGRSWPQALFGLGRRSASPPRAKYSYRNPGAPNAATKAPSIVIDGGAIRGADEGTSRRDDTMTLPRTSTPRRRSFQADPAERDEEESKVVKC